MRLPCGYCELPRRLTHCFVADPARSACVTCFHRPEFPKAQHLRAASTWWTGEDSNLRSPQGAADLQSAGFSHSPTRPVKIFRDTTASRSCDRIDRTAVRGTSQCRKGSCPKTPALALLSRGVSSATLAKRFPVLRTQLAEGVEPPTL